MSLIAIDARKYFDFGIGTYIRHLVATMAELNRSREFMLMLAPEDVRSVPVPAGWRTTIIGYGKYSLGELLLLGKKARALNVSVFHSPHYTLPFGLKTRSIVTVHDLIHLRFPQFFSPMQRAYSSFMIRHAVRDARYVITDSEFTRQDILRSFRVDEKKIVPIHLGVGEEFFRKPEPLKMKALKSRLGINRPYILFVGNTKPHKGIQILLDAFEQLAPLFGDVDLVFVGGELSRDLSLREIAGEKDLAGRVRSLGRLSDEDLICTYAAAEALVMPSLYEGFGLPALEAMACGIPVVVSDAGSLPEIVGDAAVVCEKGNAGALAEAISSVLRDSQLRKELAQRGRARARDFSWRTTAQKTLELYDLIR